MTSLSSLPPLVVAEKAAWRVVGSVILIVWHKGICAPDLLRFSETTKATAKANPDGFAVLSFTYTDVLIPDAEARTTLMEINKIPTPEYRGSVVVLTGGGFGASIARSILGAMQLVRRDRAKEVVAKDLPEGLEKLTEMVAYDRALVTDASREMLLAVGRA